LGCRGEETPRLVGLFSRVKSTTYERPESCCLSYLFTVRFYYCEREKKGNEMTDFESKCYGMSTEDIREQYMNSITARLSGLEMVAMSVLSDAQELMSFGNAQATDQARKNINIAKFILSEMMEAKETV
jgi:hypothetical protein